MASGGDDIVDVETGGTDEAIFPSPIFPGEKALSSKIRQIIGNDPRERNKMRLQTIPEKAGEWSWLVF